MKKTMKTMMAVAAFALATGAQAQEIKFKIYDNAPVHHTGVTVQSIVISTADATAERLQQLGRQLHAAAANDTSTTINVYGHVGSNNDDRV
jgi:hypothetical protein